MKPRFSFPYDTPSNHLKGLACDYLAAHARFAEAVEVVKTIPDEKIRFAAYDGIVNEVRWRLQDANECVEMDPPRKQFSSAREILDIAEMLTDEPDGKSLDEYRKKLRKYAGKLGR